MNTKPETLERSLQVVAELEEFIRDLASKLAAADLKDGDDVAARGRGLGIQVPEFLEGVEVRYVSGAQEDERSDTSDVLRIASGKSSTQAVAAKPGRWCVRIRRWIVCWVCTTETCYLDIRRAS